MLISLRNLFEGLGSDTRSQTDMTTDKFVLNRNVIIIKLFSSWDDTAKVPFVLLT
jgi:hypothetical protein